MLDQNASVAKGLGWRLEMLRIFFASILAILICGPVCAQTATQFCTKYPANEQGACTVTRDYLATAQLVVAGKLSGCNFPDQPNGFSDKYLSSGESAIIDKAVQMSLNALAVALFDKNNPTACPAASQ